MEGKIIKINLYAITFIRKQHFKIMNRWHLILFNTIFTLGVCHKNSFPDDKIIYAVIHRNLIILNDKKCNMDKIKTFVLRYNYQSWSLSTLTGSCGNSSFMNVTKLNTIYQDSIEPNRNDFYETCIATQILIYLRWKLSDFIDIY